MTSSQGERTRRALRPAVGLVALIALLVSASAALLWTAVDVHAGDARWAVWAATAVLFWAAELCTVHLETRRSAHTVNLRELPVVLGLAFLTPVGFLGAHLAGSALALAAGSRRQRGLKLAFNIALVALQGSLALAVYHAILGSAGAADLRGWAATFCAVVVSDLVGAAAVTAAIALHAGSLDTSVVREAATSGLVAALANTSLAVLAVVLLTRQPAAASLLLIAYAVLYLAYRAHVRLSGHYKRTQLLYEFTHRVGESVDSDAVAQIVLERSRDLLHASTAELVLLHVGSAGTRLRLDGTSQVRQLPFPDTELSAPWWLAATRGTPTLLARNSSGGQDALRDGAAAPLRLDGEVAGALIVRNRTSDVSTFGPDDLALLNALAAHAGVALQNGRLVDRLRDEAAATDFRAVHDALTGLLNREGVEQALAATLPHGPLGVLVLEVERFDDTSATLGADVGDQLLRQVSQRLTALSPAQDSVARLEGGSFAVLSALGTGNEASRPLSDTASRLRAAFAEPLVVQGLTLYASINVGIAYAPDHGDDAATLLQHADIAMRAARERRDGVRSYHTSETESRRRRLALATDLRQAVAGRALKVWFQPKADAATGHVTGVEALLRWEHPHLGFIPPDEFVGIAEQLGLLPDLTQHVLSTTLAQAARWHAAGRDLGVAVNVSPSSLSDASFPHTVAGALLASGVPAEKLTIEITESTLMDDADRSVAVLEDLAALGVRLSIDDFGTGYSSLAYLQRLPVHEVKIDKSFILGLTEHDEAPIVDTAIELAHRLGRTVVAEGVETLQAWMRLQTLGADTIQGYLLHRPVPAATLDNWLATRDPRSSAAMSRQAG